VCHSVALFAVLSGAAFSLSFQYFFPVLSGAWSGGVAVSFIDKGADDLQMHEHHRRETQPGSQTKDDSTSAEGINSTGIRACPLARV
jgi:hypothetical protein